MACVLLDDPVPATAALALPRGAARQRAPAAGDVPPRREPDGESRAGPPGRHPLNAVVAGTNRLTFTYRHAPVRGAPARREAADEVGGEGPVPPRLCSRARRRTSSGPSAAVRAPERGDRRRRRRLGRRSDRRGYRGALAEVSHHGADHAHARAREGVPGHGELRPRRLPRDERAHAEVDVPQLRRVGATLRPRHRRLPDPRRGRAPGEKRRGGHGGRREDRGGVKRAVAPVPAGRVQQRQRRDAGRRDVGRPGGARARRRRRRGVGAQRAPRTSPPTRGRAARGAARGAAEEA